MITVIIPCHNEALTISKTIDELRSLGRSDLSIVVVDNSSTDGTKLIAQECGVKVLNEPLRGKGRAFRRGLSGLSKSTSVVALIDGDNTYGIESFLAAINLVLNEGYEMVVGVRTIDGNSSSLEYRLGHRFGNLLFTKINQLLFKSTIEDSLSGWRVMSRKFALSFFGGNSNFELEMELNVHAFRLKVPVACVKILYRGRPQNSISKLNTFKDGIAIFRRVIQLFMQERPKVAYSILLIPFLFGGLILFYRAFFEYLNTGLVEFLPSLVVSVGSLIVALSLWVTGIILDNNLKTRLDLSRSIYHFDKSD